METESSILFLNNSQTFLGVLAAIFSMCVLVGESNFMYNILHAIASQLQMQVDALLNSVNNTVFNDLSNNSHIKLLKLCVRKKTENSPDEVKEASDLLGKEIKIKSIIYNYIRPDFINKTKYQEHFLSPLYSLIFILIMFVFDELFRSSRFPYNDFFISVLSIFTILSILYWGIVWFFYIIDFISIYNDSSNEIRCPKLKKLNSYISAKRFRCSLLKKLGIWCLCNIFGLGSAYVFRGTEYVPIIYWVLTIILPCLFIGIVKQSQYKAKDNSNSDNYEYLLLLRHILLFFIIAIIQVVIFRIFFNNYIMQSMYLVYQDCFVLKFTCIVFVLLNGLFCPAVLPLLCYEFLCHRVSKAEKNAKLLINNYISEAETFCKKNIKVDEP